MKGSNSAHQSSMSAPQSFASEIFPVQTIVVWVQLGWTLARKMQSGFQTTGTSPTSTDWGCFTLGGLKGRHSNESEMGEMR